MCIAHTSCYKCTNCGKKVAMALNRLTECIDYLDNLAKEKAQDRAEMLRARMAAGLVAPVHLVGEHSFWAWSWTDRGDAFILYPRRICIETRHEDVDWECADCALPLSKDGGIFRMIRDSLRGEIVDEASQWRLSGDKDEGVFDLRRV